MKLAICGDISITDGSWDSFDKIDVARAFSDVADEFKKYDRVLVNLECALTDSENRIAKFGPNLKAPKNTADTLKAAGVTDCMLSNNHIFDYGIEGLVDTVGQLDRCGLKWTGVGNDLKDSRRDHVMVIDGITVTVVNVCEHEYTYATEDRMGARPFDEFETMDDIRRAKASADYVIVIYHGGKELCQYPSPRLMKACREMVRCGADAVLCQHSHCIGCYEKFEGAHILYGQGNFHFFKYLDSPLWNDGLLVALDITRAGMDIDFIPVCGGTEGIGLTSGAAKEKILAGLWERSETLHDGEWKKHWHEFAVSMHENYKKMICGITLDMDENSREFHRFCHYKFCSRIKSGNNRRIIFRV